MRTVVGEKTAETGVLLGRCNRASPERWHELALWVMRRPV